MCEGVHERIGDSDRKIEVRHFGRGLFERDEVEDVRMVDTKDAHICTAPGSALFDDVRRDVEEAHEGNRSGGHAAGRGDPVGLRARWLKENPVPPPD